MSERKCPECHLVFNEKLAKQHITRNNTAIECPQCGEILLKKGDKE